MTVQRVQRQHDFLHVIRQGMLIRMNRKLRMLRGLVGVGNAGKIRNKPEPRLGIQPFDIPRLADF
ncbi:hypothetical protein D3C85_1817220 [compost metagenome]